jgi:predicted DNA-binding transcriptional regulator YafY
MENLKLSEKENTRIHNLKEVNDILQSSTDDRKKLTILLYCKEKLKAKCREYLNGTITKEYENGDFEYELVVPDNEQFWYGVILSFGKNVKVLAPRELINRIKEDCAAMIQVHQDCDV